MVMLTDAQAYTHRLVHYVRSHMDLVGMNPVILHPCIAARVHHSFSLREHEPPNTRPAKP